MKKGQEVPEGSIVLEKEKFDQMQAEMMDYLKSGNEALKNYNTSLKEINNLQEENSQLKAQIIQIQGK